MSISVKFIPRVPLKNKSASVKVTTRCRHTTGHYSNKCRSTLDPIGKNSVVALRLVPNRRIIWRHQMETFSALLAFCAGNSPVPGEFPAQRPVTRSFDVFFDLHLNKQLSKQWWGWWFETPSGSLWRQCNENYMASRGTMSQNFTCWFVL